MNRAYDVPEGRPYWKKLPLSVAVTLIGGTLVAGAFLMLVLGAVYGPRIAEALGISGPWGTLLGLARWPVILALLVLAMTFLYWAAPNVELKLGWTAPGTVLFAVVWLVATYVFSLYLATFGSYGATYGSLAGAAILLLWFYITSFIMLVGAQVNAIIDDQIDPEEMAKRRQRSGGPRRRRTGRRGAEAERHGDCAAANRQPAPTARTAGNGVSARLAGMALGALAGVAFLLGRRSRRSPPRTPIGQRR